MTDETMQIQYATVVSRVRPYAAQLRHTSRWVGLLALALAAQTVRGPLRGAEVPQFERDVLPIFTRYCFNCHGKSSPQLGLDLRSARLAMRGSQNGPVIVRGSLEQSLLWKKVSTREMPLELFKLKLDDAEIDTIRRWIVAGAPSAESVELPPQVRRQFATFQTQILPILDAHCTACHGGDAPAAELDLRTLESLVRGSQSGPVIYEGFSEKSILIRKVASRAMPPRDEGTPLTQLQIRTITAWIDAGHFVDYVESALAPDVRRAASTTDLSGTDRAFWSFQKPVQTTLPEMAIGHRVRTPIDRFVLRRLHASELNYSPAAPRGTLLRRAYFDLHGIPPSPEAVKAFLADPRPDDYERLIDRLLASPRYGERWGRHWLDVMGYVDTTGKDFDPKRATLSEGFWRYRDYVIGATNADKPWDRFLVEQIAGDELVDWRTAPRYTTEIRDLLTATGFLRNVLDATDEDISDLPFDRYEALFKLMERVSTSTFGLTLACARCHNHKFDPIPQTDYYRFLSLFTPAYNPSQWLPPKRRHLFDHSATEQDQLARRKAAIEKAIADLTTRREDLRRPSKQRLLADRIAQLPEEQRSDVKRALATPAADRTAPQKALIEKHKRALQVTDKEVDQGLNEPDRLAVATLSRQIVEQRSLLPALSSSKVQALWDVGAAPTIRLLHRGDVDFAGPQVSAGFLRILSPPGRSSAVPSPTAVGQTTGFRLAFAEWLTGRDHPLTARVIVNRSWQHHFGTGIVATPGNFGKMGTPPTHPELLDWLAVEFMNQGWSGKRLHRTLMSSAVYRQTSTRHQQQAETIDPANRYLWRMNLRRLDAESVRDSVLAISGRGDYSMGGPPVPLQATPSGLQTVVTQGRDHAGARRSVYLVARRTYPLTLLGVFDYPIIDVNCTRRVPSATPLQSLTMLNSSFFAASAVHLANRVRHRVGDPAPLARQVEDAYWLTLGRPPSESECGAAEAYLGRLRGLHLAANRPAAEAAQRSLESFVHMLQCANEFLYVD